MLKEFALVIGIDVCKLFGICGGQIPNIPIPIPLPFPLPNIPGIPSKPSTPSTPSVPSGPVSGECYKAPSQDVCDIELKIFQLTNDYRKSQGVPPLVWSKELNWAARGWSKQQAATGAISHAGFPSARNAAIRAEFPGSGVSTSGENVAMFWGGGGDTAKRFVDMWINSPGHRANMVNRSFTKFGSGMASSSRGNFATQCFGF